VLLYCSRQRQSALSHPLPMFNPVFLTRYFDDREHVTRAFVAVYGITNAFSRFHVDSEIADTIVKRRSSRDASPLLSARSFPFHQTRSNDVVVPENNVADLANVAAFIKSS